jgi:hypothetical protein
MPEQLRFFEYDKPIASLEDAIGMSIDEFYEFYKDESHESCFHSQRDFWPAPDD